MTASHSIDQKAVIKLLLHSTKHPSQPVSGLLLGNAREGSKELVIRDAVPLFHNSTSLSIYMEVALCQVSAWAESSRDQKIVGYYEAGCRAGQTPPELSSFGREVLKVLPNDGGAGPCAVAVDNTKLALLAKNQPQFPLELFLPEGSSVRRAAQMNPSPLLRCAEMPELPSLFCGHLDAKSHLKLADFDDHLDDLSKDWTNPGLVK